MRESTIARAELVDPERAIAGCYARTWETISAVLQTILYNKLNSTNELGIAWLGMYST